MDIDEWERCKWFIADALDGTYALQDVEREIQERRAELWPLERSAVVTQVLEYPRKKILRIWLAGGDLDELLGHLALVDIMAKELGCDGVEIEGRPGWERVLTGFKKERVVLTKDVK